MPRNAENRNLKKWRHQWIRFGGYMFAKNDISTLNLAWQMSSPGSTKYYKLYIDFLINFEKLRKILVVLGLFFLFFLGGLTFWVKEPFFRKYDITVFKNSLL